MWHRCLCIILNFPITKTCDSVAVWLLQALCFNCDEGESLVSHHWSFEPSNPINTLQSSDLASYSSVADNDAVLVIDLQMFVSANVDDRYDFTVTGIIVLFLPSLTHCE